MFGTKQKRMASSKIRVFAAHDWGLNGVTHTRVRNVVDRLRTKGIDVWFDETHLKGNILDAMCKGIETSDVILVFITADYMRKVSDGLDTDNVRREFMFASATPQKLLPIRFDPDLPNTWSGPLRMVLGCTLYIDMSTDETSDVKINSLVDAIKRTTPSTMWKVARRTVKKVSTNRDVKRPETPQIDGDAFLKHINAVDTPTAPRMPLPVRDRVGRILKILGDDHVPGEHVGAIVNRLARTIMGEGASIDGKPLYEKLALVERHLGLLEQA